MPTDKFLGRRQALKTLGASTLAPVLAHLRSRRLLALGHHPLVPVQAGQSWAPRFLTMHENETVATLAELIIPGNRYARRAGRQRHHAAERLERHRDRVAVGEETGLALESPMLQEGLVKIICEETEAQDMSFQPHPL